jgi:hypothetical protein
MKSKPVKAHRKLARSASKGGVTFRVDPLYGLLARVDVCEVHTSIHDHFRKLRQLFMYVSLTSPLLALRASVEPQ